MAPTGWVDRNTNSDEVQNDTDLRMQTTPIIPNNLADSIDSTMAQKRNTATP